MVAQASACGFSAAGLVQALRNQDISDSLPTVIREYPGNPYERPDAYRGSGAIL